MRLVVPRELAHGNPSFAARRGLAAKRGLVVKLALPRASSWGAMRLVVPRELAHGNQSFAARTVA